MERKKKIGTIIFGSICVIIVFVCLVIQVVLKEETKKLEKESEKYDSLIVNTKSGEKIETEYTHVDKAKFYIKIPKNFKQLTMDEITQKYTGDVPKVVFSNDDLTINIAISMTDNKMLDSEINNYHQYMNQLLEKNSEIIESKFYQVDQHNIGKIKLISTAADTKIYNNMIFFSYQDKLVIVTFNCTEELKAEWQEVGDFVIDSLFFKES